MKWFQHEASASTDAKIRKLIMRHGAEGYAVYFHCLELIAGNVTKDNITFELEHDTEIIADNLKIKGDSTEAGIDKVNRIMRTIIELGLFESSGSRITCLKMAIRLDNTISRNAEINSIKSKVLSENVDTTKLLRSDYKAEENRIDENRVEESRVDKIKIPDSLSTDSFIDAWTEWVKYRKERRLSCKPMTLNKQLAMLSVYGSVVAVSTIDASITNGWQGLFPDKTKVQKSGINDFLNKMENL